MKSITVIDGIEIQDMPQIIEYTTENTLKLTFHKELPLEVQNKFVGKSILCFYDEIEFFTGSHSIYFK